MPAIVLVGIAIVVRGVLHGAGDLYAHGAADRVVDAAAHASCCATRWHWVRAGWRDERPGELSLTATRGLRSLHTYYARYLPQAAAAVVIPVLLLAWVATQDWLSFLVVIALVLAVPVTMIFFGREATRRSARQWRRLGSLAGRFLQLVEGLPTLRAFGREAHGRREVAAATEGVRTATMRTLRVAFLSALAMDMIAGFGVGLRRHGPRPAPAVGRARAPDRDGGAPRRPRDLHPPSPGRRRVPRQHGGAGRGGTGARGARHHDSSHRGGVGRRTGAGDAAASGLAPPVRPGAGPTAPRTRT